VRNKPSQFAGAIVALIEAFILMLVSLNVIQLTDDQTGTIMKFVVAFVMVASPIIGAWWVSRNSTSLANPKDADGTPFVRSDGAQPLRMQR